MIAGRQSTGGGIESRNHTTSMMSTTNLNVNIKAVMAVRVIFSFARAADSKIEPNLE
jgi:hypothetical protein